MDDRQMLERVSNALAACNRGDLDAALAAVAEDVIWRDVVLGVLHGRDALYDATRAYWRPSRTSGSSRRRRRWRHPGSRRS